MDSKQPRTADEDAAEEQPEIGRWRGERAQSSLVGKWGCTTPRGFKKDFPVPPGPEPSRWSLSFQQILGTDEPGGNRIRRRNDPRKDLDDSCDLGIGVTARAKLKRRIEFVSFGRIERQELA